MKVWPNETLAWEASSRSSVTDEPGIAGAVAVASAVPAVVTTCPNASTSTPRPVVTVVCSEISSVVSMTCSIVSVIIATGA